jgi:hypothetical protein
MKASESQFMSRTFCAERWTINFGVVGYFGYMVQLNEFGDAAPPFFAIVGQDEGNGLYSMHVLTINDADPEVDYSSQAEIDALLANDTYVKVRPPADVDSWEKAVRCVEASTAMLMHGKHGPHPDQVWKDRWAEYINGSLV